MANVLTDPPFAADPPVKLNVNAKIIGLVVGIVLAVLGVIDLLGMLAVFGFCGLNGVGVSCGLPFLWLLGSIISLGADVIAAWGGFQLYQLNRGGKALVAYGLALAVVGQIVTIAGTIAAYSGTVLGFGAGAIVGFVFWLVIRFIVYYLVIISRFPGEAPLVASPYGGGYGSPPPPPAPPA